MTLKPTPQGPSPQWLDDFVNSYEPGTMTQEQVREFNLFMMIHGKLMDRDALKDEATLEALGYGSVQDYYQCILPKLIPRVEHYLEYLKGLAKEHNAWES